MVMASTSPQQTQFTTIGWNCFTLANGLRQERATSYDAMGQGAGWATTAGPNPAFFIMIELPEQFISNPSQYLHVQLETTLISPLANLMSNAQLMAPLSL